MRDIGIRDGDYMPETTACPGTLRWSDPTFFSSATYSLFLSLVPSQREWGSDRPCAQIRTPHLDFALLGAGILLYTLRQYV
jgi:hypothetical protein